jgi:DNA-binding response OmpR family regulator
MECSVTHYSVLLIEDDVELLRQMNLAFLGAGYDVRTAADGQAGLACFQQAPSDLVVTDIIMPNREGIETIMALRKASPTVRILAISGGYRVGPADFLELARHVGADGSLAKPFRPSALTSLAGEVLGRRHAAVSA